ncbi:hypothetical protein SASPL_126438 [Salvia splendens]|uniref:Uncharacterized protein n=1 Tax=Salvia splendens TaxID=180675 RepID=A0A8X8XJH6_SALSN|nr:hypothetical protein SASPL_126438 [Salvia splendens]
MRILFLAVDSKTPLCLVAWNSAMRSCDPLLDSAMGLCLYSRICLLILFFCLSSPANTTLFEVEHTKDWPSPTHSTTAASAAAQKSGEGEAEAEAECKADDGWVQFEEEAELQRRRNATLQMMNLSCSSSSSSSSAPTPTIPSALATMQFNPQDFFNIFFQPYHHSSSAADAQTLQLFPLQSDTDCHRHEDIRDAVSLNNIAAPFQFFEFLPLKN